MITVLACYRTVLLVQCHLNQATYIDLVWRMCQRLLHYYYRQCSGDISARDPVQSDQPKSPDLAEYASELWVDDNLGHIRKAAIPNDYGIDFVYDPAKEMFGFQEGMEEQEEDEDQELFFIDAHPTEPEILATTAVGETPQPQPEPQQLLLPSTSLFGPSLYRCAL